MVNVAERSRPSPESKKFDINNFPSGTDILYFDDVSKKWKVGMVNSWVDPVKNTDGKLCGNFWTQENGVEDLTLSISPKKIDKVPSFDTIFKINGKEYQRTELSVLQDTHEVELTLVNITNSKDRLENINLKTIKNLEAVEKFEIDIENEISNLKREIATKADSRVKEILIGLTAIEKKIKDVSDKLGTLSEWQEIGQSEAEQIGREIKQKQEEIKLKLSELNNKLKGIEKRKDSIDSLSEEANGLQSRLDRDFAKRNKSNLDIHAKKVEDAKTLHDTWKKNKESWDKNKKAKEDWDKLTDKKGKQDPGDPGVEPVEPPKPDSIKAPDTDQARFFAAWELFDKLKNDPNASAKHKDIIKKVEDAVNKQAKREGFVSYTDYDDETKKQVIAEHLQKVLNVEKGSVSVEGEKFDLEAEKGELKTKINELVVRADAVGFQFDPNRSNSEELRLWLVDVENVSRLPTESAQENKVLSFWQEICDREVSIYKTEQDKKSKVERVEENKSLDIPDTILRELFADRSQEVKAVMELIYTEKLKTGEERKNDEAVFEAVKNLMAKSPDKAVLQKLRQYGIKNWDQFKVLWDNKLAKKSINILDQWGRADLDSEVAKQVSGWDTFKALKWQIGAQLAVTVACGIGGAAAVTAIFASGGAAGIGLVAAGGAGGIGIRNIIRKMFGKNEWLEARKKKALEEMFENKRRDIVASTLDKRFGGAKRLGMTAETNAIFSSIMAEAIRTASEDSVKENGVEMVDAAKTLKGDSKKLYIQALENAREAGVEYSVDQKIKFALALKEISARGEEMNAEAVKDADLSVVKMMEFGLGGLSGKWTDSKDNAVAGWAATLGIGAAVSVAVSSAEYSSVARGVMGGLGGGVLGYKVGESWRKSREVKQAEETFLPRFNIVSEQMDNYLANQSSLDADSLKKFGEEIKSFNRYLKGEANTKEEQKILDLLKSNPLLSQRTENLVYQANRRGVFARINLAEMQQNAQEIAEESNIKLADSTKSWLKKRGWQAGSIAVGAVVGASLAIGLGMGARELREYFTVPERIDTSNLNAKLSAEVIPARVAQIEYVGDIVDPDARFSAEDMPIRPAGLIEAPSKAEGFDDWRHQIMEKMGYKFHGGKIDHALRFHPGAKIALMHPDGTPVLDAKGHAVDYTFKKGGSTWDAMDHLKSKANGLLKAGEVPTIKIEGADTGKVEVLDKYQVESHTGGKTDMKTGEVVPEAKGKQLDWVGKKEEGVHDLPGTDKYFGKDGQWVNDGSNVHVTAEDGKVFDVITVSPADGKSIPTLKNTHHYFVNDNHIYNGNGRYIGEQNISPSAKTDIHWSKGGAVADKAGLESMLNGTRAGGPAEVGTPQGGKGVTTETILEPSKKAEVTLSNEVPTGFKGHEAEYRVIQDIKTNVVENLRKDEGFVLNDKAGEMNKLLSQVQNALQKNPALFKDDLIGRALDSSQAKPTYERLTILVEQLNGKGMMHITDEQNILLGTKMSDNLEEFIQVINGEKYIITVAKGEGGHAMSAVDSEGNRMVVTNSKVLYNKANVASVLK